MKKLSPEAITSRQNGYLFLILVIAGFLRFYKLNFQSLWLDELYTLLESDPDISWSETYNFVNTNENKSPLYFFVVKLFFLLFGHTDFIARSVSALAGIISVLCIYTLGKEIQDKRTGLFLALLTAINPFHLYYSQEARGYIFVFLFTVLSTLYLFRLLKQPGYKNAILFGLFSILICYFHPFGLIVIVAQTSVYLFYLLNDKTPFKARLPFFLAYVSVMFVAFLPLIKALLSTSEVGSSWIEETKPDFFIIYFLDFFGNTLFLKPLLILCYLFYFLYFFRSQSQSEKDENLKFQRVSLYNSVFLILCCILIPYLYSIYKTPALVIRYMIIALPTLLLILAQSLSLIQHKKTGLFFLSVFVFVSLSDTLFIKNYFSKTTKTQFREVTEYIKTNSDKSSVILNEKTGWHQSYYLKTFSVTSTLITEPKEVFVDSLIKKIERKETIPYESFWIVGAHLDPKPTNEFNRKLERYFFPAKSADFFDAWAYKYLIPKTKSSEITKLDCFDFPEMHRGLLNGDSIVTIWEEGPRTSRDLPFPAGEFELSMLSKGTSVGNIYPHLTVYVNDLKIGGFSTQNAFALSPELKFTLTQADSVCFKVIMDNDTSVAQTKEDRNAFIKGLYVRKKN